MSLTFSRRGIAVVLGCLALGSMCPAQEITLERFAGGATLQDVPGTTVPLWPQDAVTGPDGVL